MHGYAAYRTEWEIFDEDLMIAGSVDLCGQGALRWVCHHRLEAHCRPGQQGVNEE